jgi:hypothetical protein
MSKKSENLSGLKKKDRNKCHSSPFINVVRDLFFVVRVTLVPVPYLSSLSAVHSYRVPGKCIRRVNSLFVGWTVYSPSTNKANIIRIAYLYSKCTDCRIFSNNIGLGLGFLTPLSPILKLYRESQFYCWRKRCTRRKRPTCCKWLTNVIIYYYSEYGIRTQTLVVIWIDCICSCHDHDNP